MGFRMSEGVLVGAQVAHAADALDRVRAGAPLVQCITNSVVTGFTANALLAVGAAPAMVDIPVEAGLFAGIADSLLVNLGTPRAEQRAAAREAVEAATAAGRPWVLDPVAVGALPVRTALAAELVGRGPRIVRGNASEIAALAGRGAGGRGVDAVALPEDALSAVGAIARMSGAAVAVSGAVDLIGDGESVFRIANGSPLLARMTGGGCALGAVMAAFAAVSVRGVDAAVAATLVYTVAAEQAAERALGPGSFAVLLLDRLAAITPADVLAAGRVS